MNTLTAPSPFLQAVADAGDEAVRADRHRLASLVAELASGRRPSITAEQTGELLRRLNMPAEVLEELVATRQRLNVLREQAGREPELRSAMRDALEHHTRELEEIKVAESALRARRERAEATMRQARAEVEALQAAARQAGDAIEEFLNLLHPGLAHDTRTAASGCKIASSKIGELTRRIRETEAELAAAADAEFTRPELKATKIRALEESLATMRKDLEEAEQARARATKERETLAAEAALLVGEEVGRG